MARIGIPKLMVNISDISVAVMEPAWQEPRVAEGSHGDILARISDDSATTIAELARQTRKARSTVDQRVKDLTDHGFLVGQPEHVTPGVSTGGRPARRLRLRTADNLVFAIDLGASHCRMALMDIGHTLRMEREDPLPVTQAPPETILRKIDHRMREMLTQAGEPVTSVKAIGIGVPAPIEYTTGKPSNPPILGPGWNGHPIREFFEKRYGGNVTVRVDNDVNIMALGEHRHRTHSRTRDFMLVKVGTGIGCGIIAGGRLHRGAQGCAGDIGHIRISENDSYPCHCGRNGCLEALASGAALARRLSELGHDAASGTDVIRRAADGHRETLRLLQEAGRQIGGVLAGLVNFFNPEVITIGGVLAQSHDLIAGIRTIVGERALALATSNLRIEAAHTGARAAMLGAGILAIEYILAPDYINRQFEKTEKRGER
jgi:predicted NBD/HSP70 family sugar kinase